MNPIKKYSNVWGVRNQITSKGGGDIIDTVLEYFGRELLFRGQFYCVPWFDEAESLP